MAFPMTRDAVIARASAFNLAWLLGIVAALHVEESAAQNSYQQQQQAYLQQQIQQQQQQSYQQQLAGQHYLRQQQEQQQRQQQQDEWQRKQAELARQFEQQQSEQQARLRQAEEIDAQRRRSQEWVEQQDAERRRRESLSEDPPGDVAAMEFDDDQGAEVAPPLPAPVERRESESPGSTADRPVAAWPFVALAAIAAGLMAGALATWALIDWRRRRETQQLPAGPRSSINDLGIHAAQLAANIAARMQNVKLGLARSLRNAARNTKRRLRSMIPSRQMVIRLACLLVGSALVLLALFGFTQGRLWESSLLLPVGYLLATGFWILAWKKRQQGPDTEEIEYLAAASKAVPATPSPEVAPHLATPTLPAANRPFPQPTALFAGEIALPEPHFAFRFDLAEKDQPPLPTLPLATPLPPAGAVRLQCRPCGKQFDVRGQGEIAFRLVPCPQCGSAMETLGPKRTDIIPEDPAWVPIISIFCQGCRGLIDVPYSTFGTSIDCPRCQANLPVPRLANLPGRSA
jgi:hypothetical protein